MGTLAFAIGRGRRAGLYALESVNARARKITVEDSAPAICRLVHLQSDPPRGRI